MEHPSGQQLILRHGTSEAVVTEVGGGIRTFRVGQVEVLDGFPVDRMCDGARGQSLLPWPNRIEDGRYAWDGQEHQLPLTEPARRTAIHGLTRWANWELLELAPSSVRLRHRLHAQPGWPFLLQCQLHYVLGDAGLEVRTSLTNVGPEACPVAAGAHPYLSAGGGLVDGCRLQVPARSFLPTDDRGIPTGRLPVAGSGHDLQVPRALGDQQLDEAFGDLVRDADGRAVVRLHRPDGHRVQLWAGEGYRYLEVFTGDTLAPDRRRRGLGIEPMTAPPNAFRTGEDVVRLEPGEQLELAWGVGLA
jgi:aldose 1-epimerase